VGLTKHVRETAKAITAEEEVDGIGFIKSREGLPKE
jgi:hypothetical protein